MEILTKMESNYNNEDEQERHKTITGRRRRRMIRRNIDIIMRAMLLFLTGFLCGTLFACLFIRTGQTGAKPQASVIVRETAPKESLPDESGNSSAADIVVIDAGHGGSDPGSMVSKIWESKINLQMALKLQSKLEARNVQVLMTRTDDTNLSLADRASLANDCNADLFISIHQNSYTSSDVRGMEFFYNPYKENGGEESEKLARLLDDTVQEKSEGSIKSRGLIANKDLKVLRTTTAPAVLIEVGYLTNSAEEKNLLSDSYQDKLMEYIADGIMDFLSQRS